MASQERVIRVGVIALGRSGWGIHCKTVRELPREYQLVAVADPMAERRQRATKELGVDAVEDYRDLLKRDDIDLIVNAGPTRMHVPASIEALQAGCHVLCDKPLAGRVEDVDRVIDAAKKAKRTAAVFQQWRTSPVFRKINEIIDSGVLGRIVQININFGGFSRRWDWQTLKSQMAGSLLNTGPHPLDMALALFGFDAEPQVFCAMDRATSLGDAEDHVKLILRGPGRPMIDIEISSCKPYGTKQFYIYGTQGGLTGGASQLEWKFFDPAEAPERELTEAPIVNAEGDPAYCREDLPWQEQSWTRSGGGKRPEVRYYEMLYRHLVEGAELEVKMEHIRRQAAVIQEAHRQNPHIYGD